MDPFTCCPEWNEDFAALLGPDDISPAFAAHFEGCERCRLAYDARADHDTDPGWDGPVDPLDDAQVPRLTVSNWRVAGYLALIALGVAATIAAALMGADLPF